MPQSNKWRATNAHRCCRVCKNLAFVESKKADKAKRWNNESTYSTDWGDETCYLIHHLVVVTRHG